MRNGFTLVELVIVIVIMAMLSTIAAISLGGTIDRYRIAQAAETIERFDARARRDARITDHDVRASIDRSKGRLWVDAIGTNRDSRYQLPQRVSISNIRLHRRSAVGSDLSIEVDRLGHSPSYAVELTRGKLKRWVVILGASGQVVPMDNESEVNELLSL